MEESLEDYTVFSSKLRLTIAGLLSFAMLASPLTATTYLPLLPLLASSFGTSTQAINLTITVYVIFQAISPLLLASVSDHFGRRPIYLFTFLLYDVSSLGLALTKTSYAGLLVLRAAQSLGASAVLSLSYGTIADITTPATRGKLLGPMLAMGNVGTCIGPIIGGWIALASGSFVWAFWALFIFGVVMLVAMAMVLPETARNVVGNGSVMDDRWNQSIWQIIEYRRPWSEKANILQMTHNDTGSGSHTKALRSFKLTSPFKSLRLIFYKDTSLIVWISSSYYALWYCVQASIPSTFAGKPYNFTALQVGLAYLPGAAGVILSMYVTGRFLDWSYKRSAERHGFPIDKKKGDDIANFPIEEARTRASTYLLPISACVVAGYGWTIQEAAPVYVPLILQCFQGFLSTWFSQCYNVLLVDSKFITPHQEFE